MLCHYDDFKKLSIKQGLKTQYFVILKKYTEKITYTAKNAQPVLA